MSAGASSTLSRTSGVRIAAPAIRSRAARIAGLPPERAGRRVLRRLDGPLDDTVPATRPISLRDLLTFTMGFGLVFGPPDRYPIVAATNELELGQGLPSPATPPKPDEWIR